MSKAFNFFFIFLFAFCDARDVCAFEDQLPTVMRLIYQRKEELFGSESEYPTSDQKHPNFGPKIKNACPNIDKKLIRKTEDDQRQIFGAGSYGKVFKFNLNSEEKAIKSVEFERYVKKRLYKRLTADEEKKEICINSIIEKARDPSFFIAEGKPDKRNPLLTHPDKNYIRELQPVKFHMLKTEECADITDSLKEAVKTVNSYFSLLKSEIGHIRSLSNLSREEHDHKNFSIFPYFDYCIISKNLDVYFVMEKLDYSLSDALKTCPSVMFETQVEKRIKMYMELLYQIYILNINDLVHCDIKPSNIMFRDDKYESVSVVDFGFVNQGICRGSTPDYESPEFASLTFDEKEKDSLIGMYQYQKHDVFSLGITFLETEIGPRIYSLFEDYNVLKQSKDISLEEKDSIFKTAAGYLIQKELNTRYLLSEQIISNHDFIIDSRIFDLILEMTAFDYKKRLPAKAALNQLLHLYKAAVNDGLEIPDLIEERLKDFDSFKKELASYKWILKVEEILAESSQLRLI